MTQSPSTTFVRLKTAIALTCEATLRSAAQDLQLSADVDLERLLKTAAVESTRSLTGARVLAVRIERHPSIAGNQWSIEVDVDVQDSAALMAQAREAVIEVWQDKALADELASNEEALFELLCASNSLPSPDMMGIEYLWRNRRAS